MAASLKDQINDLIVALQPKSIVGLDIGSHSIKVCEVSGKIGKVKVEKIGVIPLPEASIIEDEVQKPSDITQAVLDALKEAGISSRAVCLGLFGPNTMIKRLGVPDGTKEEIEDHIMWEIEQYITFGADDSKIDFNILENDETETKEALVAAAKIEVINSFSELLKEAKISTEIVDLSLLALSNVFEEWASDELETFAEGSVVIDYGAQSTKILVYKKDGPIFSKELPIGGSSITEEIQRQMGVSYSEAEDLKTTTDNNGNLPEEILVIINSHLDSHVAELKKNLNFYLSQGSTEKVSYCFVTGGASLAPGFIERLSMTTGIDARRIDLFDRIKGVNSDNKEKLSSVSAVVVGLAMRKLVNK